MSETSRHTMSIKSIIAGALVLFSLVGGVWAFDAHFVPRSLFEITMVGFQQDRAKENAQRDVTYWLQIESNLRVTLAYIQPGSQKYAIVLQQIENAAAQKMAAQARLSGL